ncbi:MAG: alginate lyase family protein [Chloroflexi bacterium]|nr:alginate lyase family protein [Chloroflexota bacterium]
MPIFNPNDLTLARQRVKDHAWSAEILAAIRARADAWRAQPADAPTLAGGWVHDYACPDHWGALAFDPATPHAHRCPVGGETRAGEKLDAAWRVIEHRRLANAARDLALVFALTDDRAYADAAGAILTQYAQRYSNYTGADAAPAWMLKGRAFQQALTEAIWAVPIAQTFDLIRATLTPEQETLIVNAFLRPLIGTLAVAQDDLVQQQNRLTSNYNAWLLAALGLLGYALRDQMLIERAISSPAGFRAHLAAAILPDGFEHEATPYYHNFVALAYTILAEAARANDRDLYGERGPDGQSIEAMWGAFASLAFADGSIPQIGDGAYWRGSTFASEICEVYEIALARTNIGEYAWLLKQTYRGAARDTWSALLCAEQDIAAAPTPARKSFCLASCGIAILRDETRAQEVCVPFGAYAGSHSHLDRATLEIFPWSTDPGNTPYGTIARLEWHQQTAAHNTIVVDGQSQTRCQAQLLNWEVTPDTTIVWLAADDAYPGVRFTRLITLANGIVKDSTLIDSAEEHIYDWIIHADGECLVEDLTLEEISGALATEGAYRFVAPYAHRQCAGKFQARVKRARAIFHCTVSADAPLEIILAHAPARADAPMQPRQMLIARARQRRVNFVMTSRASE